MRRSTIGLLVALPTALLSACVSSRAQSADADSALMSSDSIAVVSLARGACHGTCPIYGITLHASGRVLFSGERFVQPIGRDSTRIASAAVVSVRMAFDARKFEQVPTTIEYNTPSCGTYVADLPTVVLSVATATGEHRVRYDQGCRNYPRMLDTLAQMIDSVSGASRWTSAPNRP